MAQSTVESWDAFLQAAGIPAEDSKTYAADLHENRLTDHHDLTKEVLKEIGVRKIGDILCILKYSNIPGHSNTGDMRPLLQTVHPEHTPSKPPTANAPPIKAEMTNPEFRKLKIDWEVFQSLTNLPTSQLAAHIYTSCDSSVQTSIINSTSDFFKLNKAAIFALLENIVTKRSNPPCTDWDSATLPNPKGRQLRTL